MAVANTIYEDANPRGDAMAKKEKPMSPALGLLDYVWKNVPYDSHREMNAAMQVALRLAVESRMEWAIGDCKHIGDNYRPGYWMGEQGWEPSYARACDGPHGPNPSAIKAIEAHLGRKPFIVRRTAGEAVTIRLHVGAQFHWHDNMKARVNVEVTSFSTKKVKGKGKDAKEVKVPCVVACSYKYTGKSCERKIDRVFKISHDDIAAYHKAIRDHEKTKAKATADEQAA